MSTAESIAGDLAVLRKSFQSGATRDLKTRQEVLSNLQRMLIKEKATLNQALYKDLHRHPTEGFLMDTNVVLAEIQQQLDYMDEWGAPERVWTNLPNWPGWSYIHKDPLGVVCVIGTWNCPINLTLTPMVGAVAAGNCVLLRLPLQGTSDHTNELLATLLLRYLGNRYVRVVRGHVDVTHLVLKQKFDLIFCTGGQELGKMVARAAAETLTPTVLELGGKCPTIVDGSFSLDVTARRVAMGRFVNAGQICMCPDYVLVHSSVGDELINKLKRALEVFFGENPQESDSYSRLIHPRAFDRVTSLVEADSKFVVHGGDGDRRDKYVAPTIVNFAKDWDAFEQSASMQSEIFGPVLPVVYYDDLDQALDFVNKRDKPLALYAFTSIKATRARVLSETSSGGVVINDCLMHFTNSNLPFGGVGGSGMGSYHGKFSYDAFTHKRAVLYKYAALDVRHRYLPYDKEKEAVLKLLLKPVPMNVTVLLQAAVYSFLLCCITLALAPLAERFGYV